MEGGGFRVGSQLNKSLDQIQPKGVRCLCDEDRAGAPAMRVPNRISEFYVHCSGTNQIKRADLKSDFPIRESLLGWTSCTHKVDLRVFTKDGE